MTNFEYIIGRLTPRDFAVLATNHGIFDILFGSDSASSGSILDGSIQKAYKKYKSSFNDVYHKGNIYKENAEKHPNVFEFDRVHVSEKDKWIMYGHGSMLSFQIWLEMPFNKEDWRDTPDEV